MDIRRENLDKNKQLLITYYKLFMFVLITTNFSVISTAKFADEASPMACFSSGWTPSGFASCCSYSKSVQ
jgi:hypothetical protein